MRITNSMLVRNMMTNLKRSMSRMHQYESQLSTGKRITKISQDPVGVIKSLQARKNLSKSIQYKENAEDAQAVLDFTETALMEINNLLKRAYELTVNAPNDTNTPSEKEAIAVEIDQIRHQVINALNSTYGSQHIFGGYNVATAPFREIGGTFLYNGEDLTNGDLITLDAFSKESIEYLVGNNVSMDVTMSGARVVGYGENNMIQMLADLSNSLRNDDPVDSFVGRLQESQEHILALVAEIGGKSNRIQSVIDRFDADIITYEDVKARMEDIDQAETIMYFKMEEAVFRTALAVGARVIQPSLVDFLR